MLKFFRYAGEAQEIKWGVLFDSENSPLPCDGFDASALFDAGEIPRLNWEIFETLKRAMTDHVLRAELKLLPITVPTESLLPAIPSPQNCVAVGMNYRSHADDVGLSQIVLFPKPVAPTSHCATLERASDWLLDWEIELGLVLRRDISRCEDLDGLPLQSFIAGFVLALDMSNRKPQILFPRRSFTAAKSDPGLLPIGAFFLPIENFALGEDGETLPEFRLQLSVNGKIRQEANSCEMIHAPRKLVRLMLRKQKESHVDHNNCQIPLLRTDGLRRGDLILTGTPVGTALQAPTLRDKIRLVRKAVLSIPPRSPRALFLEEERLSGKYLKSGDEVRATISHLGEVRIHVSDLV